MAKRPEQWKVLRDTFQSRRGEGTQYDFLSSGIETCIENASGLCMDFSTLATSGRNARAQFVYATAMEEMGKALILLDFARTDMSNLQWTSKLCKAFYNHTYKGEYARTVAFPGAGSLADALYLFKHGLIEYWPRGGAEDTEPEEYADSITEREWAVYVDWNDFDHRWWDPSQSSLAYYYAQETWNGGVRVGEFKIKTLLEPLLSACKAGLFSANALVQLSQVFTTTYITGTTREDQILGLLGRLKEHLAVAGLNLDDDVLFSNVFKFPLYSVILTPEQIKLVWES